MGEAMVEGGEQEPRVCQCFMALEL